MTQNGPLTIISCLRNLTIIASFIPRNNLLFFFNQKINKKSTKNQKKKTKRREKKVGKVKKKIFFRNCPKKGAKRTLSTLSTQTTCQAEETTEKSSTKCCTGYTYFVQLNWLWKVEFLSQPISKYRNRTTTLIPFFQTINHFCNFIHSHFMARFTFLIELTSYMKYQLILTKFQLSS